MYSGRINSKINRTLQIEECIGKGAFSAVYAAHNLRTKKKFALKKIFLGDMHDKKIKSKCMREVRLLQVVQHPNIIQYFCSELSRHDGALNVVLELAANGDLSKYIANCVQESVLIPEYQIWKFIAQISAALGHMHSMRIMHRDLKPANIFLTSQDEVKIGDFGMAKYFPTESKSSASATSGSPYYMSPERLLRKKYYFDSDIWSLGCIIYELAALLPAFYIKELDINKLITKVVNCDYPRLLQSSYSNQLKDTISMCIETDRNKRPEASYVSSISDYMLKTLKN